MALRKFDAFNRGQVLGHRVYTKDAWADDWTLQAYAFCTAVTWTCAPSIGSANIYYRYGRAANVPGVGPSTLNPYTLPALAYVKIEVDVVDYDAIDEENENDPDKPTTVLKWHGLVGTLIDQIGGTLPAGDPTPPAAATGTQQLQAIGIEWLLERDYITESLYREPAPDSAVLTAARPIDYNAGGRPNRDDTKISPLADNGYYVFSGELSKEIPDDANAVEPSFWTVPTIVENLVNTFSPEVGQEWNLDDPGVVLRKRTDRTVVSTRNARRRDLLNRIMARQRGLSYRVYVDEDDSDKIKLQPISFSDVDIDFDGRTLLADNPVQHELQIDQDRSAQLQISSDSFQKYDVIRCRGARAVYCFTASLNDGSIVKGWSQADQDDYWTGSESEGDYPAATERSDRQNYDFNWRDKFPDVYDKFFLSRNFSKTPEQSVGAFPVVVDPDAADPKPAEAFYWSGCRVLPFIPLKAADGNVVDLDPRDELIEPIVVFDDPGKIGFFEQVNDLGDRASVEGRSDLNRRTWSARVVTGNVEAGFQLSISGEAKHVVDGKVISDGNALDHDVQIGDYELDTATFTIAITCDHYCEGVWPASPPAGLVRERLIDLGDKYQYMRIAEDTVIGFNALGTKIKTGQAEIVRDDRTDCQAVARLAYQWYGTQRTGLEFSTSLVTNAFQVGDMITTVTEPTRSFTANTVVTEIQITFDVAEFDPKPSRITYKTNFAELDFAGLTY